MADCITVQIAGLLLGDPDPDGNGIRWTWTDLDGWWETPDPVVEALELAQGEEVTSSTRGPRNITVDGYADTSSSPDAYWAALARFDELDTLVDTPDAFVVNEPTPRQIPEVLLAKTVDWSRVGELKGITFQIQLYAADPTKVAV